MSPYSKAAFLESGVETKVSYDDYLTAYLFALASDFEDFREAMEYFDPLPE